MAASGDEDRVESQPGAVAAARVESRERRRLLRLLMGGSGLALAGIAAAPVARYLRPLAPAESEAVATLEAELALWQARRVVVAGRPVLVVRTDAGLRAFSAECTHLGCVVKWRRGRREFFCPCHGARFDSDGRVRGGPAPRPLVRLDVQEEPGRVVVRRAARRS
jgi:cytochrome b6-f complex iron-sulfur subunit